MLQQIISIAAAMMILSAYAANHLKWFDRDNLIYIILNLVGSAILAIIAARSPQAGIGLVVVEGSWSIISLVALVRVLTRGEEIAGEFH
jgi:hypothetical protein